jgi:hypothetical protein
MVLRKGKLRTRATWVLTIGSLLVSPVLWGKALCCTDESGRRICADTMPQACQGRDYKVIGSGGASRSYSTTQRQLSTEEKESIKRKTNEERDAIMQRRRDTSLLTSYANEKEIIIARDAELSRLNEERESLEDDLADIEKKGKSLRAQLASDTDEESRKSLEEQVGQIDLSIRKSKKMLADKSDQILSLRARFEELIKRYRELSAQKK